MTRREPGDIEWRRFIEGQHPLSLGDRVAALERAFLARTSVAQFTHANLLTIARLSAVESLLAERFGIGTSDGEGMQGVLDHLGREQRPRA